jgi:hypothetical protein
MTTTGEITQLIRMHDEVFDGEQLRAAFAKLRCLDYDASRRRWVWLNRMQEQGRRSPTPSAKSNFHGGNVESLFDSCHNA